MQWRIETSRNTWQVACAAAATAIALSLAGAATAEPPPPRNWDLMVNLYGWIPASNLEVKGEADGNDFGGAWAQIDENGDGWFTNTILDGKVGYRVLDMNPPLLNRDADHGRHITLDLLAGARYRNAETNVDADTPTSVRRWHDNWEWVDPVVGVAWSVELLPNLYLGTVADIGGFDIGNASSLH